MKKVQLRFAFDNLNEETKVYDAILSAQKEGFKNISVYVLVGFNDCEEEARYRLEKVKEWGARPDPMRYQPLDTLQKNSFVGANWTDAQLHKICRYYFRSSWVSHIPYDDFNKKEEGFGL